MIASTFTIHRQNYITRQKQYELASSQLVNTLESEFKQMDTTLKLAYMDVENLEKLLLGPKILGYYEARIKLMQFFTQSLLLTPRKDQYVLLDTSGSTLLLCHNDAAYVTLKSASAHEWFQDSLAYPDKTQVFASHEFPFIAIDKPCFAVSRAVLNPQTLEISAVAMLYQDMADLNDLFLLLQMNGDEIIVVNDNQGKTIFSNTTGQVQPSDPFNQQGFSLVGINDSIYISTAISSEKLGWTFNTYIPFSQYPTLGAFFTSSNIGVILALLILSMLLSLIFSLSVTKPLSKLATSFLHTERGDFDHPVEVAGNNEIALIGHAYNRMNEKIQTLIHEKYELTLSETQARLNALQCQINPHFLFNTLNSIKAISSNETAAQMIQALSNLMRYTLSNKNVLVPFKDELRLIKDYIYLHQCRFGDRCAVEYDVDADTEVLAVPHLAIQPIVENAIIHGLEPTNGNCCIIVTAKQHDGRFRLYISNTGDPIEKMKLVQINTMLKNDSPNILSDRIGLANVWCRLRLNFGDSCSMRITSSEKYTTVYMELPAVVSDR